MGGIGSGRRFQSRRGPNLEEVPQLDVRALKRNYWHGLHTLRLTGFLVLFLQTSMVTPK